MSWLAHSREFARIDVTRARRKIADKPLQLLVYVLLFAGLALGPGYFSYRLGGELVAGSLGGDGEETIAFIRGMVGVVWAFSTFLVALRSVGKRGTLSHPEGVLTTIPTTEVVLGVLLAETSYALPWALVPGLGIGVGLAVATGEVAVALTVPVALVFAGVAAVAVGYPIGLGVKHLLSRFEFVAENKSGLAVLAFAAYFLFAASGEFNQVMASLFEPMQSTPVGWLADVATGGLSTLDWNPLFAGIALATAPLAFTASVFATSAIAERHWFSDPVLAGQEETDDTVESGAIPGPVERRLAGVVGRPTASLIVLAWRRAGRAPMKLLYAAYPLLFLTGVFANILQTGRIPTYLPYGMVMFVVWAVSVIFTLNPLGDQGAVLPTTLLSQVGGREFVFAHVLAGLVVGLPIGTVVTGIVAVLSPVDVETAVVLTAATPVLLGVCSVLAVGIGVAFPRYEAVKVTRSMKAVVPSRWAFVLFTLYLFVTTGAAVLVYHEFARILFAGLLTVLLPFGVSVSTETVLYASGGALVPLVLAPVAAYRYTVRRFETFTVA